jgi:hypothetical protein
MFCELVNFVGWSIEFAGGDFADLICGSRGLSRF